ncbi:hypothetical protein HDU96_000855 [Phlyctochytrium bullatum]|nr:hypothetical protein HDU96_000855 [Phlyctochytrium bullatum]
MASQRCLAFVTPTRRSRSSHRPDAPASLSKSLPPRSNQLPPSRIPTVSPSVPSPSFFTSQPPSPSHPPRLLLLALLLLFLFLPATLADYIEGPPAAEGYFPTDTHYVFNATTFPDLYLDPSAFRAQLSRRSDAENYNLTWRVEEGDMLHGVLALAAPRGGLRYAWLGLGFGGTMLDANFLICHLNAYGPNVRVHRHNEVTGYYTPPVLESPHPIERLDGGYVDAIFFCEFQVPLSAIPPSHRGNLIWAYNPNSLFNTAVNAWLTYHGSEPWSHGMGEVRWEEGVFEPRERRSFAEKQAHGFGMAIVWLIIFPAMVFYSRFFRSTPKWIRVHYTVQSFGVICVFAFLIVILRNFQNWSQPHAILGISLISCMVLQGSLGVINRLKLIRESLQRLFGPVKRAHALLGVVLLLGSVAQVALGLQTLYPWSEPRGKEFWHAFIAIVVFWITAFVFTEGYFMTRVRLRRPAWMGHKAKTDDPPGMVAMADPKGVFTFGKAAGGVSVLGKKAGKLGFRMGAPTPTPYRRRNALSAGTDAEGEAAPTVIIPEKVLDRLEEAQSSRRQRMAGLGRRYTWADIAAEVRQGRVLVVANKKWVYDASMWIDSHPGGAIVLWAVAGTDISFDFFRDSGFDAADVTPVQTFEPNPNRQLPTSDAGLPQRTPTERSFSTLSEPIDMSDQYQHSLTELDWLQIHRARRRNVHSYAAVQRLAQYYCGDLVDDPRSPDEYRRYAVTAITLVSKGSGGWLLPSRGDSGMPSFFHRASSGNVGLGRRGGGRKGGYLSNESFLGAHGGPVYKIRFCLLHPTPESFLEPVFVPGDTVEVQARVGGRIISRYYTPINGNPVAFEVLVRVKPGGLMSSFLAQQKPGDRQIKIRGPVGRKLLQPSELIPEGVPRDIYFLAGGTGIAPCLQIVNCLLLPLHQPISVTGSYDPTAEDELELRAGDQVVPYFHFLDGWACGINLTTGQNGVFALSLTRPPCRPDFKLIVVASIRSAADASGMDILRAAELAYPKHIEIHWAVGMPLSMGPLGTVADSEGPHAAPASSALTAAAPRTIVDFGDTTLERTMDTLGCGAVHRSLLDLSLWEMVLRLSGERRLAETTVASPTPSQVLEGIPEDEVLRASPSPIPTLGRRSINDTLTRHMSPTPGSRKNSGAYLTLTIPGQTRRDSTDTMLDHLPLLDANGNGPLVIVCGPEAYVQAVAAVVKSSLMLKPRELVLKGGSKVVPPKPEGAG